MISPLLPFVGGLRNQAAEIMSIIAHYAGDGGLFADPFFGGGSISYEAKKRGYRVWCNDLATRSLVPATALIQNADPVPVEAPARLIQKHILEEDWRDNARIAATIAGEFLTFGRRLWHNTMTPEEKYLAMRVFMDLVPAGAFGIYKKDDESPGARDAHRKAEDKLLNQRRLVDKFRHVVNGGIFKKGSCHAAVQGDAVGFIAECAAAGAVACHIDPPTYGTKQYDNRYWWLDWFVGDKIEEGGRGFTKDEAIAFSTACVAAADPIKVVAITQQQVAYDHKAAFKMLEDAGREVTGYILKSNTSNPFFTIVGVKP